MQTRFSITMDADETPSGRRRDAGQTRRPSINGGRSCYYSDKVKRRKTGPVKGGGKHGSGGVDVWFPCVNSRSPYDV